MKVICSSPVRVFWGRWALGRPCRRTDIHRVCSRLLRPWRWSQRDQLDRQMTRRVLGNPLETRGHPGCPKNAKNRHFLHPRTSNHLEEKAKGAINNQPNENNTRRLENSLPDGITIDDPVISPPNMIHFQMSYFIRVGVIMIFAILWSLIDWLKTYFVNWKNGYNDSISLHC